MEQNTINPFVNELTGIDISRPVEDYKLPEIRIDLSGKILYANEASFEFLNEWHQTSNEYLPDSLVQNIPGILDLRADFSAPLKTRSQTITFDIIGFEESGYIGLYGRRQETELLN